MQYYYFTLIAIVGVLYPLYAVYSAKEVRAYLTEHPEIKAQSFKSIVITQWIFTFLVILGLLIGQDAFSNLGMDFIFHPLGIISLLILPLPLLWFLQRFKIIEKNFPTWKRRYEHVLFLMPANKEEYKWGMILSYTAGICEEIVYRGFLFWQLSVYLSVPWTIFLVNFIFALSHASSQLKNVVLAFSFGILWSILFYFTGSIWLPILIHICVDIYSLTKGYQLLQWMKTEEPLQA